MKNLKQNFQISNKTISLVFSRYYNNKVYYGEKHPKEGKTAVRSAVPVHSVVPKPDPKFGYYGNTVSQKLLAVVSAPFKWATVCAKVGPQEL